jgi:hypothetical protein
MYTFEIKAASTTEAIARNQCYDTSKHRLYLTIGQIIINQNLGSTHSILYTKKLNKHLFKIRHYHYYTKIETAIHTSVGRREKLIYHFYVPLIVFPQRLHYLSYI